MGKTGPDLSQEYLEKSHRAASEFMAGTKQCRLASRAQIYMSPAMFLGEQKGPQMIAEWGWSQITGLLQDFKSSWFQHSCLQGPRAACFLVYPGRAVLHPDHG